MACLAIASCTVDFGKSLNDGADEMCVPIAAQVQQALKITDNGLQTHRQRTLVVRRYVHDVSDDGLSLMFFSEASTSLPLPAVLTAPIRLDVVQQVHSAYLEDERVYPGLMENFREHRQEQKAGIFREREGRPPNERRIVGYWSRCCPYSPCWRRRNPPFGSGA